MFVLLILLMIIDVVFSYNINMNQISINNIKQIVKHNFYFILCCTLCIFLTCILVLKKLEHIEYNILFCILFEYLILLFFSDDCLYDYNFYGLFIAILYVIFMIIITFIEKNLLYVLVIFFYFSCCVILFLIKNTILSWINSLEDSVNWFLLSLKFIGIFLCGFMYGFLINLFEMRYVTPNYWTIETYKCYFCDYCMQYNGQANCNHHYDLIIASGFEKINAEELYKAFDEKQIRLITIKSAAKASYCAVIFFAKIVFILLSIMCIIILLHFNTCYLYTYISIFLYITIILFSIQFVCSVVYSFLVIKGIICFREEHFCYKFNANRTLLYKLCSDNHWGGYICGVILVMYMIFLLFALYFI